MKIFDIEQIKESLQTLQRNKMRSFLTAFGIFWGMFMLIFLLGGGQGMKTLLDNQFKGVAQNSCFIGAGKTSIAYQGYPEGRQFDFTFDDINLLRKSIPELDIISPVNINYEDIESATKKESGTIKGILPSYVNIENPEVVQGRTLNDMDNQQRRKVCVIGKQLAISLFGENVNPCGQYITFNGITLQVIGLSNAETNLGIGGSSKYSIFIPLSTFSQIYNAENKIGLLAITIDPKYRVSDVQSKILKVLAENHHISPKDEQAFFFFNLEQMFRLVDSLFKGINILIWLIGMGTILSGAIGVSNIMMITVRDRTSEIGIRRALGARMGTIISQILTESMILVLFAGFSGLFLGVSILAIIDTVMEKQNLPSHFLISFDMAIFSIILFLILGVLSGIFPCVRALSIKPVDAIRDE